jgi:hypothetical protein
MLKIVQYGERKLQLRNGGAGVFQYDMRANSLANQARRAAVWVDFCDML